MKLTINQYALSVCNYLIGVVLVMVSSGSLATSISGYSTKSALFLTFNHPPSLPIGIWSEGGRRFIEICDDSCSLVSWSLANGDMNEYGWDAQYVLHYHFNTSEAGDKLRRLSGVKTTNHLIGKYGSVCDVGLPRKDWAKCVLAHLKNVHGISLASVRYDEGFRCVIDLNLVTMSAGEGRCFKLRNKDE